VLETCFGGIDSASGDGGDCGGEVALTSLLLGLVLSGLVLDLSSTFRALGTVTGVFPLLFSLISPARSNDLFPKFRVPDCVSLALILVLVCSALDILPIFYY